MSLFGVQTCKSDTKFTAPTWRTTNPRGKMLPPAWSDFFRPAMQISCRTFPLSPKVPVYPLQRVRLSHGLFVGSFCSRVDPFIRCTSGLRQIRLPYSVNVLIYLEMGSGKIRDTNGILPIFVLKLWQIVEEPMTIRVRKRWYCC